MRAPLFLSLLLAVGCINPYAKYYSGTPNARLLARYQGPWSPATIQQTDNLDADVKRYMRQGYFVVGMSSFTAQRAENYDMIRDQARDVGAHMVLLSRRYLGSVVEMSEVSLGNRSDSETRTQTGEVISRTSSRGSQNVLAPTVVSYSHYGAVFLAKSKPPALGIVVKELTEAEHRSLETNAGVIVDVVVEGSPAFAADIIPGDILLSVSGEPVAGIAGCQSLIKKHSGEQVTLHLIRTDRQIDKTVTLAP